MKDITGILVLIESEDYKNAVEMDKEDYINDGVMMILIAVQVIFEEQQHHNFAMNICFGLAQCDDDNQEMWENLKNQKIGVIDAIHKDLEENGIHIEKGQIPLFYLSSKEQPGTQQISQQQSFLDMMNFFESKRENDPQEIIYYHRPNYGDLDEQIDSLYQRLSIMGGEHKRFSFIDKFGDRAEQIAEGMTKKIKEKGEQNKYFKLISDADKKIQKMKENLAVKVSQGENLKLIYSEEQRDNLTFWERIFAKTKEYSGKIKISHIESHNYTILAGGEGYRYCKLQRPVQLSDEGRSYIKIYGQHKDFKSYKTYLENSKRTLRELIKYKEKLVRESEEENMQVVIEKRE